jgi:DNA-binding IclR family transcriptional regulator
MRMSSKIGNRRHLHTTAIGKVLLGRASAEGRGSADSPEGFAATDPHTLVTRALVMNELEWVRRQGYAIDNQEN